MISFSTFSKYPQPNLTVAKTCQPWLFVETRQNQSINVFLDEKVMIDVIHGGWVMPEVFYESVKDKEQLQRTFVQERDWGAHTVAQELAKSLDISGYYAIPIS